MERCEHYTLDCEQEKMGCRGCAYNKKSADEMFEELDFEKDMTYENVISYEDEQRLIEFWTDREIFTCDGNIDKKILQAINKKVEELRMEIIIRIIVALGIVFCTGLVIGMLWGLYIEQKQHYMKLSKIKIQRSFKERQPVRWKMESRWEYYRKTGELHSPIVINDKGYLVDGYTSYLIAKAEGIKEVEVIRR